MLSDANTIGTWVNNQKLPNDRFSIENAIILKNSTRWYLYYIILTLFYGRVICIFSLTFFNSKIDKNIYYPTF